MLCRARIGVVWEFLECHERVWPRRSTWAKTHLGPMLWTLAFRPILFETERRKYEGLCSSSFMAW